LSQYIERAGTPLLRLYNLIGGGALARGSVFALGIAPYLSARVMMFLARHANPGVAALTPSRKKWWTRGLTVGLSLIQSAGYAKFTQNLPGAVSQPGLAYTAELMLVLTSVSTLLMLFAEEATSSDEAKQTPILPRETAREVWPTSSASPATPETSSRRTPPEGPAAAVGP
jgi:preprotein translocase subunit SecY